SVPFPDRSLDSRLAVLPTAVAMTSHPVGCDGYSPGGRRLRLSVAPESAAAAERCSDRNHAPDTLAARSQGAFAAPDEKVPANRSSSREVERASEQFGAVEAHPPRGSESAESHDARSLVERLAAKPGSGRNPQSAIAFGSGRHSTLSH